MKSLIKLIILSVFIGSIMGIIVLINPKPAYAQDLSIISYNVESDADTNPNQVAEDITTISQNFPIHLWGLSEVESEEAAQIFTEAATTNNNLVSILGTTGGSDRLQIIYDRTRLELVDNNELPNMGGTRSPLVGQFRLINSDTEFIFMVNHFNRGDAARREAQAENVRRWITEQSLPVVAVGDYNFDWDLNQRQGNQAFDIFTQNNDLEWIRPTCLESNTCPTTGTQCNPRFESILDFVFVGNQAQRWSSTSSILFTDNNYCQKERNGFSDHRPLLGQFEIQ